jgi:hypothetical protein
MTAEKIRFLVLDDQPPLALTFIGEHLRGLNARVTQPDRVLLPKAGGRQISALRQSFSIPWSVGVELEIVIDALGEELPEMLACVGDSIALARYDVVLVDRFWEEEPFQASDFGVLGGAYDGSKDVGLVLVRYVFAHSKHEPIVAMFSQMSPQAQDVVAAIKEGAFQFIDKMNKLQFYNLFANAVHRPSSSSRHNALSDGVLDVEKASRLSEAIEKLMSDVAGRAHLRHILRAIEQAPEGFDPATFVSNQSQSEDGLFPTSAALDAQLEVLDRLARRVGWKVVQDGGIRLAEL